MRLSDAVYWAAYRTHRVIEPMHEILTNPYIPGDIDEAQWIARPEDVRSALAIGKLIAWGQRDYSTPHEVIPAIEWSTRPVSMIRINTSNEPYIVVRVSRVEVLKLWPAPQIASRVSQTNRGGRPTEIDWSHVREQAEQISSARPDIGLGSLAATIAYDLPPGKNGKPRDSRGIEKRLKSWGFGTSA